MFDEAYGTDQSFYLVSIVKITPPWGKEITMSELDLACQNFKMALSLQNESFEESIKKKWLLMSMQSTQKKMKKSDQKTVRRNYEIRI